MAAKIGVRSVMVTEFNKRIALLTLDQLKADRGYAFRQQLLRDVAAHCELQHFSECASHYNFAKKEWAKYNPEKAEFLGRPAAAQAQANASRAANKLAKEGVNPEAQQQAQAQQAPRYTNNDDVIDVEARMVDDAPQEPEKAEVNEPLGIGYTAPQEPAKPAVKKGKGKRVAA